MLRAGGRLIQVRSPCCKCLSVYSCFMFPVTSFYIIAKLKIFILSSSSSLVSAPAQISHCFFASFSTQSTQINRSTDLSFQNIILLNELDIIEVKLVFILKRDIAVGDAMNLFPISPCVKNLLKGLFLALFTLKIVQRLYSN